MRFAQGFALPIVLLISVVASSLLAYDLHRLQAQAQLSRISVVKDQVELIFEIEGHQFIKQLNAEFEHDQCPCQIQPQQVTRSFYFQNHDYGLTISLVPSNDSELEHFGVLSLIADINIDGQFFSWNRYSYITTKQTTSDLFQLEMSQLVQYL